MTITNYPRGERGEKVISFMNFSINERACESVTRTEGDEAQNKTTKGSVIGRTSGPIREIMSRRVIEQCEKLDNS